MKNKNSKNIKGKASSKKRSKLKIVLVILAAILLVGGLAIGGLVMYGQAQMEKIPGMTFYECLSYTMDGCKDGVVTVGIIKDGEASYTVYGENAAELPKELHTYEIGSITKTMTAAMIQNAMLDGKLELDKSIDEYLDLTEGNSYPTINDILTHTSGFKAYYFESPMTGNFFGGRNSFCGITDEMMTDRLKKLNIADKEYAFEYSNFGFAVLGLLLENAYGNEYTVLFNEFAAKLGLADTHISDGEGDLGKYWDWCEGDAYLPAGAVTSNIEDMLKYAQIQLDGSEPFAACHKTIKDINVKNAKYDLMDINMDAIGMAWITDNENGFTWHNGATGHYDSYLGINPENGTAVVILSNLEPDYRIPATVMGVKLLNELR